MIGTNGDASAGKVTAMVTDSGPHSPEYWAAITAGQIVHASDSNLLRTKLVAILLPHHRVVQARERSHLIQFGDARLNMPFSTAETIRSVDAAVDEIIAAGRAMGYAAHFDQDHVQLHLKRTVAKDFATNMNIERLWFADNKNKKD